MRRRAIRELEAAVVRDVSLAWRTANFTNAGSKLRNLSHYLDQIKPQHERSPALEAAAAFTALAARGLVTIVEVPKEGDPHGR